MNEREIDEVLEAIWKGREAGESRSGEILGAAHAAPAPGGMHELEQMGLVILRQGHVRLTDQGEGMAAAVIRRHRLAERLFTDVLGVPPEGAHEAACWFEHGVVPEVTNALCTLLGHPEECPDGKPIPQGSCCEEGTREIRQALSPLDQVPCAEEVRVAYLRPGNHDRLHMLLSMGIVPGSRLHLHQRRPLLVVEVDGSEIAMDQEVAKDVVVWRDQA